MINRKRIIQVVLFITCLSLNAQVGLKDTLINHLNSLEKRFECHFSYTDKTVADIQIEIPQNLTKLTQIVDFLNRNTGLYFVFISQDTIAIRVKDLINICGYIVDYETGEAVDNVTVNSGNKATLTNDIGYFELLDVDFKSMLSIRHVSYKSIQLKTSSFAISNCDTYSLIPRIEHMSEILIRNYITRGIQKTVSGELNINYKNLILNLFK